MGSGSEQRRPPGDFWLVLGLAAAFRLPLLLFTDGIDYWFYQEIGEFSNLGFYPYLHYWLEYPPVFPWLAVAVYRFALLFPPTIFHDFATTYHLLLGAPLVAADLAIVALIYAIGQRLGPRDDALRRTALYTALLWPVLVAIGWYDTLPALCLFLGLYLVLRGRAGPAGLVTGLGFMTKVFPLLLLPVALKFLPRPRDRILSGLGALAVTIAIAAPLLWLSPTYFIASYRATFSRSAWETVWALLDGYTSFGKVAPLGVRFDPSTALYVAYRARLPGLPIALGFGVLYAVLWLRPVARTARNVVLFTALSTLLVLFYSKGYSPQFIIYVLPFVVLLLPWRRAIGYTIGLSAVNFLQWPLYHEWLNEFPRILIVAVIGRTILWLGLCWEWLAELWGLRNPLRSIDRRVTLLASAALLVLSCFTGVATWQSWPRAEYNRSELKPAFDFIRRYDTDSSQRAAFVFADNELYQQFSPYFWRQGDFYLFRPEVAGETTIRASSLTPAGRRAALDALARDHRQVFLIRTVDDWTSRDLNAWLIEHARLDASMRVRAHLNVSRQAMEKEVDLSVWQLPPPAP